MRTFILTILAMFLLVPVAQAEDAFPPSRVRLLVHGGHDVDEDLRIEYRFVPAGNLIGELAPVAMIGAKIKTANWLGVEMYSGLAFKPNEPLISLTLNPHFDKVWAWTETDLRMPSSDGYWFAQAEYKFEDWFHAGIEGEGWGNYKNASSWSHGGGTNVLFRFGTLGVDLAIHAREINERTQLEFFLRTHLFL